MGEIEEMKDYAIKALTYTLEEVRIDIKLTIRLSEDKTAIHHLHTTIKNIESILDAVYAKEKPTDGNQ